MGTFPPGLDEFGSDIDLHKASKMNQGYFGDVPNIQQNFRFRFGNLVAEPKIFFN